LNASWGFPPTNHLLTIGVKRVMDNPFCGVDFKIILEAEMSEALRDGLHTSEGIARCLSASHITRPAATKNELCLFVHESPYQPRTDRPANLDVRRIGDWGSGDYLTPAFSLDIGADM
jgi:hypothetical protein